MGTGKVIFLDFEFNKVVEPRVNLVSCATYSPDTKEKKKWWLHNSPQLQAKLAAYLKQFKVVFGYSCVAEARSYQSLGLNPLDFDWVDMFLEYRMLTNHNDTLNWGKQLVDGKVKFFKKPENKWKRVEGDEQNEASFKPTHSLAEATFKLTGQIRDTKEKDDTRKLIISDPEEFTTEEREQILNYNMDDVVFLPELWEQIKKHYKDLAPDEKMKNYFDEAIVRGRYSAHTALMESTGYPIDVEATRNFSKQIPHILMECQRDINEQFPDIKPFKWDKKNSNFSWNQKVTRDWVKKHNNTNKWMKTETGQLSLSLEAFERVYQFKHDYPRGNFGAQIVRFLKLKQSLYGFSDSGGKRKNFWDSVGSDGRVRPYMNIFGAQSGRSQPAASGFMFLKPAWMRALVTPKPGRFIAGIDFGQQEFFLSALESEDSVMIEAYLSGDPYLYGAKLAGAIPKDGTKESHKIERDLFKNTYLGILYGMTKYGLAQKLTNDTGREYTEEDAQKQIDIFEETFEDYMEWKKDLMMDYGAGDAIRLPCGWRMWSDNDNIRSVCNVPIQGFGASIMRKSVDLAVARGCSVIFTLHDAIYIEDEIGKEWKIAALHKSMVEGFQFYFKEYKDLYRKAAKIKLDPFAWSPSYKKDSEVVCKYEDIKIEVPTSNLYIDERAIKEYEKFKKYFSKPDSDLL